MAPMKNADEAKRFDEKSFLVALYNHILILYVTSLLEWDAG